MEHARAAVELLSAAEAAEGKRISTVRKAKAARGGGEGAEAAEQAGTLSAAGSRRARGVKAVAHYNLAVELEHLPLEQRTARVRRGAEACGIAARREPPDGARRDCRPHAQSAAEGGCHAHRAV